MTELQFNLLVEQVRTEFFPRWDVKREWRVVAAYDDDPELYGGSHGKCNGEKKTITINRSMLAIQDVDENWLLLIHEMAHTQEGGHGKKWHNRMEKAAQKAQSIGRYALSKLILDELEGYRKSDHRHICVQVYESIRDAVMDSERHLEFEDIMAWVSWLVAVLPGELLAQCKRARAVYDKAVKEKGMWP